MDLKIRGRTAVVSGGARGTGLAIARKLSEEGCNVVLTGRDADMVREAEKDVAARGGKALGVVVDPLTPEGPAIIKQAANAAFGRVAINVFNFATMSTSEREFLKIDDGEFEKCYQAYFMAPVRMLREFLPDMVALNWGRVVSMGSGNMKNASIADPLTAQSVRGSQPLLFKNLSYEYGPHNITFNIIAIGAIMTDLARSYLDTAPAGAEQEYTEAVAVRRWGTPEELAAFTVMLCAEENAYLTGETIRFDGGQTRSVF